MNKRLKITLIAVLSLLVAATAVGVTYAYLQNTQQQPNTFKVKEDKVSVTETFTEPTTMQIQNEFEKKVAVQNTGTSDQFVRVYLDFSIPVYATSPNWFLPRESTVGVSF